MKLPLGSNAIPAALYNLLACYQFPGSVSVLAATLELPLLQARSLTGEFPEGFTMIKSNTPFTVPTPFFSVHCPLCYGSVYMVGRNGLEPLLDHYSHLVYRGTCRYATDPLILMRPKGLEPS
jgi:hypothetical protein